MKKILGILLLLLTSLILVSCTKTTKPSTTTKEAVGGPLSLRVHYKREQGDYTNWALWLWPKDGEGRRINFNGEDEFGVYANYTFEEMGITEQSILGFIVAKNPGSTWDAKDVDADRFIDFSLYEKDKNNIYHIYLFQGDRDVYSNKDKLKVDNIEGAQFLNSTTVSVLTSNPVIKYELFENGVSIKTETVAATSQLTIELSEKVDVAKIYKIKVKFEASQVELEANVKTTLLYDAEFESEYYYNGELGAIYTSESTTFKVWSPVSQKIVLKIYESGTPKALDATKGNDTVLNEVEMTKGEKGVFSTTVTGDLEGKYYTYCVYNSSNNGTEIVDPYAKSTGINGSRGMIVDFSKTNPEGWATNTPLEINRGAAVIYETHVADVTSSVTWGGSAQNAKKFLGLIEEGTRYTPSTGEMTVTTGFDHIKELGVNYVQLLPIFDQANDEVNITFNWGYNPLNYNSLEGAYSSNPYDGYAKIIEFKKVVQAFHEAGINIIMDVVYNHVNGAIGSNFDVLMPGYYFRYTAQGDLSNGSGCGNETASDHLMYRKFMIDSVTFWQEEYKLGGFRFDLMGLHDMTTMEEIVTECKKIDANVLIFGEPWNGGSSPLKDAVAAKQANIRDFNGYAAFNDKFRDELVKGGLNAASALSWISNTTGNNAKMEAIEEGIKGNTRVSGVIIGNLEQTINYVTCHDNYTLYDRFYASGTRNEGNLKRMAVLAQSMVLTSQGTSFMLAGEEFLRTKGGNSNSYNASYKVNELDYSLKVKNNDVFNIYQKLIDLKVNFAGLHLDKDHNNDVVVELLNNNNTIKYTLSDDTREYVFIHQNSITSDAFKIDLTGYTLYLDTNGQLNDVTLGETTLKKYETIIAYKNK